MLKNLHVLLVVFLLVCPKFDFAQTNWIRHAGGISHDECMDVEMDSNDDSYTCGYFNAGADFQTEGANSAGFSDAYVAKWDDNGEIIWVTTGGGAQPDRALAMATDAQGYTAVTGYLTGSGFFGTAAYSTQGDSQDIFVAYLDPNGNIEWLRTFGGPSQDSGFGIDFALDGTILLTGQFQGEATFGEAVIASMDNPDTGTPSLDIFIARLDLQGDVIFVKSGQAPYDDRGLDITSDLDGNIYLCGQFSGNILFEVPHINEVENAAFIMMFDALGNEVWFRQLAALFVDCNDLQLGPDGNVILLGDSQGVLNVLSQPIEEFPTGYSNGAFLLSFFDDGDINWFASIGSNSPVSGKSIDSDEMDNLYVAGTFRCQLDQYTEEYGEGLFNSAGWDDPFISKFDDQGNWEWARSYGSPKDAFLGGVAANSEEQLVIAGGFRNFMSIPANESFTEDQDWNVGIDGTGPNQGLTFCTYADYGDFSSVQSSGGMDIFIANPYHPSVPHYDYYDRNDSAPCDYTVLTPCVEDCQDPIEICAWESIHANSKTGWPGHIGPEYEYLWPDGGTDLDTTVTDPGLYLLQINRADDCQSWTTEANVNQSAFVPLPVVTDDHGIHVAEQSITLNFDLCAPNQITIDLNGLSDDVEWSHPEFLIDENTLEIDEDVTITVTQENAAGCVTQNYLNINLNGEPQDVDPLLTLLNVENGPPTILEGDSIEICSQVGFNIGIFDLISQTTSINGANVEWSIDPPASNTGGGTLAHFLPQQSGWYTVDATLNVSEFVECGEVEYPDMSMDVYIEVLPIPTNQPTFSGPELLCPGDTVLITVSGGGEYTWLQIPEGAQILAPDSILTPVGGTFKVESNVTSPEGCNHVAQEVFNVVEIAPPPMLVDPESAIVCPDETVTLIVPQGIAWEWISPDGDLISNAQIVDVSTPGSYHCLVSLDNGCTLESEFVEVNAYQSPFLVPVPGDVFCDSDPIEINIQTNPEAEIEWLAPLNSNQSTVTLSDPGTYEVQVTLCGITSSLEISLSDSDLLSEITVGGDGTLCGNDPVVLYANPGMAEYVWLPEEVYADSLVVYEPGEYILAVTDSLGCTGLSDPVYINDIPTAAPVIADTTVCFDQDVVLTATGFGDIFWYADPELEELIATGATIDLGTVEENLVLYLNQVQDDCASITGEVFVNLTDASQPLDPYLSSPLCEGGTIVLSVEAIDGVSYQWTTNENEEIDGSILILEDVTLDMSGEYLIHSFEMGCEGPIDTLLVEINEVNPPEIAFDDSIICDGDSLLLSTSGFEFYEWLPDGSNESEIWVDESGDYSVSAIDENGCASSSVVPVNFTSVPDAPSPQEVSLCYGENAVLASESGEDLIWMDGAFNVIDTMSTWSIENVTESLAFYIQSFENAECPSPNSVFSVELEITGEFTEILGNTTYCEGETLLLTSSASGPNYYWSTPQGLIETSSISVDDVSTDYSGQYQLLIESENCMAESEPITVAVGTYPVFNLEDQFSCEAGVLLFEVGQDFDSYLWNEIPGTYAYATTEPGLVELVASNYPGCVTTQEYLVEGFDCPSEFPNVFSPGTDGRNDVVNFGLLSQKIEKVSIYNRWGNLINEVNGTNLIWTGTTSTGDEASTGVYYYVVSLSDSVSGLKQLSGHITLLR